MEQTIDWAEVTRQTLYKVLGEPTYETPEKLYWPGRDTQRGDKSKSLTYTLTGEYQHIWYDWSVGIGGMSAFKFLNHWHGWSKEESATFLRSVGILPDSDPDWKPTMEWKKARHDRGSKDYEAKRALSEFANAIARNPKGFVQAMNEALVTSQEKAERLRQFTVVSRAWSDEKDPILEALLTLCEQVDDDNVFLALQTWCMARSFCVEQLAKHDCLPELSHLSQQE